MKALITGSFDPVTNGHINLIKRTALLFDDVTVGIFVNSSKKYLFTEAERLSMLSESIADIKNAHAEICSGLVAKYCKDNNIDVIVKGVRNASDYEYELGMAKINREFAPNTETLFLPADSSVEFISSSMVKIFFSNGENVSKYVPKAVLDNLNKIHQIAHNHQ